MIGRYVTCNACGPLPQPDIDDDLPVSDVYITCDECDRKNTSADGGEARE